jgi:chromosome segregation ATPase
MQPCEQAKEIQEIKERLKDGDKDISTLRIKQAEIAGDVSHIRARIENGMSTTIRETHDLLVELNPKIQHHASIVARVEDIGWWISKAIVIMVIGMLIWAIGQGYVPKL